MEQQPDEDSVAKWCQEQRAYLQSTFSRALDMIRLTVLKRQVQRNEILEVIDGDSVTADTMAKLQKYGKHLASIENSQQFQQFFDNSKSQLDMKGQSLIDAVSNSLNADQQKHTLVVQNCFARALDQFHVGQPENKPPNETNPPDKKKPKSFAWLEHELVLLERRFSFEPLKQQQLVLPCTLIVRIIDTSVSCFPPAVLYLPASYPEIPPTLTLPENEWNPSDQLFTAVRTKFETLVLALAHPTISDLLNLWHNSINQVIISRRSGL